MVRRKETQAFNEHRQKTIEKGGGRKVEKEIDKDKHSNKW
jgi:hypothetical protein